MDGTGDRSGRRRDGRHEPWWPGSLLGLLSQPTRDALLRQRRPRVFEVGDVLMRQGDPPTTGMLVILSGRVKVTGSSMDGQDRVLAFRGAGDVLGELGLISGEPRTATVIVVRRMTGMWMSADEFGEFLASYSDASEAVLGTVVAKLRMATLRRLDFDSLDVIVKIAMRLLEQASFDGVQGPGGTIVKLTQRELAELVGASIPSVQKAIRQLRSPATRRSRSKQGSEPRGQTSPRLELGFEPVIDTARGLITILRLDVLERLAGERR